ncbi:hypothetical protein [Chitinilyticum aquatile]|uniref:hypothetical protein n=1 Tax=Chitinilyticum aquatile TaxID=362520 RepID=UPI0003F9267F|nr:hypothetical protein [Chitinilyticum aquatile]
MAANAKLRKLTPRQREVVRVWNDLAGYPLVKDVASKLGLDTSPLWRIRQRIEEAAPGVLIDRQRVQQQEVKPAANDPTQPASKAVPDMETKALRAQIAALKAETLDADYVKRQIFKLAETPVELPRWLVDTTPEAGSLGVPTLFASDWHWAEVVDPRQINGVNEYNLEIAHQRASKLIQKTISLLRHEFTRPCHPGIVFALGGDMVSGDIHDELMATNAVEIMPAVHDLIGVLAWCITTLADEFGAVFVPCVSGNHGRNTHKTRAKGRNYTSFDWLAYVTLARLFENDKRITFLIPDGPDAYYRVFGTRYLLTHGDQFRGGDGMIGALGPIIRGDHRKRSRNGQIDAGYDVMLLGHWHQYIHLQRLIVNGSLKGYDEYAYSNNFGFERARQALWITHPVHGITFPFAVNVDDDQGEIVTDWVSVAA